jgi:DNA-binding CsgD family transcriptional regulator
MCRDGQHAPHVALARTAELETARHTAALHDAGREVAALLAVSTSIVLWESFHHGSERLLRDVSVALDQAAAALWVPDEDMLVVRATWSDPQIDRLALERTHLQPRRSRCGGLAGRAWESREPIEQARPGTRPAAAGTDSAADDLTATVGVPAVAGNEVVAVLELYSRAPAEFGEHVMRVLAAAGNLLGAFLVRRPRLAPAPITERELDVLSLAADGFASRQIAEELSISRSTVKTHFANIGAKLGGANRTAAVAYALRAGLIE